MRGDGRRGEGRKGWNSVLISSLASISAGAGAGAGAEWIAHLHFSISLHPTAHRSYCSYCYASSHVDTLTKHIEFTTTTTTTTSFNFFFLFSPFPFKGRPTSQQRCNISPSNVQEVSQDRLQHLYDKIGCISLSVSPYHSRAGKGGGVGIR